VARTCCAPARVRDGLDARCVRQQVEEKKRPSRPEHAATTRISPRMSESLQVARTHGSATILTHRCDITGPGADAQPLLCSHWKATVAPSTPMLAQKIRVRSLGLPRSVIFPAQIDNIYKRAAVLYHALGQHNTSRAAVALNQHNAHMGTEQQSLAAQQLCDAAARRAAAAEADRR